MWVSALQLTVIPLVITNLLATISGAGAKSVGKLGMRTFLLFLCMLLAAGVFAILLTPIFLSRLNLDPTTAATMSAAAASARESGALAAAANNAPVSIADWLSRLTANEPRRSRSARRHFPPLTLHRILRPRSYASSVRASTFADECFSESGRRDASACALDTRRGSCRRFRSYVWAGTQNRSINWRHTRRLHRNRVGDHDSVYGAFVSAERHWRPNPTSSTSRAALLLRN